VSDEIEMEFFEKARGMDMRQIMLMAEEIAILRAERDVLREMLTMYNVGGWTDLAAIIEDTKSTRARLAAAERVVDELLQDVMPWNATTYTIGKRHLDALRAAFATLTTTGDA
jgi:hypothetical protein